MTWREFIASLADSLAWPVSAAVVVFLLRRQLAGLLEAPVKRWKAGPVEVEYWAEEAGHVAGSVAALDAATGRVEYDEELEQLAELAERAPEAAIVSSFQLVEREVRRVARDARLSDADRAPVTRLVTQAVEEGLITPENVSAIRGLATLRNLAAHAHPDAQATPQRAKEYVALVQGVLYALSRPSPPPPE